MYLVLVFKIFQAVGFFWFLTIKHFKSQVDPTQKWIWRYDKTVKKPYPTPENQTQSEHKTSV